MATAAEAAPLSGRKAEASANDERVLASARAVLTADPDATMATIAKHAGVGVGSLYRRFPSKGDLARRLCLDGMEAIVAAGAGALKDDNLDPWETLARFVHEAVDAGAGSLRGLAGSFDADDEVMAATTLMISVMDDVVGRAHKAGALRDDVGAPDLGLVFEMVRAIDLTGVAERDHALRHRYLDLMLPGLRAEAKGPLPAPPPTFEEIADSWRGSAAGGPPGGRRIPYGVRSNRTMVLTLSTGRPAPLLAAHVSRFDHARDLLTWRRAARRLAPEVDGIAFACVLPFIASGAGLGRGLPDPRRQILLTAWREAAALEGFRSHSLARALDQCGSSWWAAFAIVAARGTHHGAAPLHPGDHGDGPFAALTLGRSRRRAVGRFLWEGARVGALTRTAPGLITACSAGNPLTGNCTLSVWENEQRMLDFAYRHRDGHVRTARSRPPILAEQLNARMRLLHVHGDVGNGTLFPERLLEVVEEPKS